MDINSFQSDYIVSKQLSYSYSYCTSTGTASLALALTNQGFVRQEHVRRAKLLG